MFADITLPGLRKTSLPEEYAAEVTDGKHRLQGLEEREIEWGGRRLSYALGGDGPPLVLVHGLGSIVYSGPPTSFSKEDPRWAS